MYNNNAMTGLVTIIFVSLVFNALLSIIPAKIAGAKGRSSGGYYALSFFVSFLIALILVAALPPIEKVKTSGVIRSGDRVKCPHCAETIFAEAKVCKHCGRDVEPQAVSPSLVSIEQELATPEVGVVKCRACGGKFASNDEGGKQVRHCPNCGSGEAFLTFSS